VVRDAFTGRLDAIERRVHDAVRRAVMALTIVADAVDGPMSVWSDAIAESGRELHGTCAAIETDLVGIAACEGPVAGDLRRVLVLIEVSRHVGLIANQFGLISEQLDAIGAGASDGSDAGKHLAHMAKLAGAQLHRSLRALVTRDVVVARSLDRDDDAIDALNRAVCEAALRPESARELRELALRQVLIARSLERVGDNAVDIAEQVVFLVTAALEEFTDASHRKHS
jgi:phosphate transport system protein